MPKKKQTVEKDIAESEIVRETELPAVLSEPRGIAAADLPDVPIPYRERVAGIIGLGLTVRDHLGQFAVKAVQLGLALQEIKQEVGHGRWLKFFRAHIEGRGLGEDMANNYMRVAEHVRLRAAATGRLPGTAAQAREQLLNDTGSLIAAMGEVTSAETWSELWRGLGMIRPAAARGGDQGGGQARQIAAQSPNAARQAHALKWADGTIRTLRELILGKNIYVWMTESVRNELALALYDCNQRIKNGPPPKTEGSIDELIAG